MMTSSQSNLESLSRAELQSLAKKHGLKVGNKSTSVILDTLQKHLSADQPSHEEKSTDKKLESFKPNSKSIALESLDVVLPVSEDESQSYADDFEDAPSPPNTEPELVSSLEEENLKAQKGAAEKSQVPIAYPVDEVLDESAEAGVKSDSSLEANQISQWLKEGNLSELAQLFREEKLDTWDRVKKLDMQSLRMLGIRMGTIIDFLEHQKEKFPQEAAPKTDVSPALVQSIVDQLVSLQVEQQQKPKSGAGLKPYPVSNQPKVNSKLGPFGPKTAFGSSAPSVKQTFSAHRPSIAPAAESSIPFSPNPVRLKPKRVDPVPFRNSSAFGIHKPMSKAGTAGETSKFGLSKVTKVGTGISQKPSGLTKK